MKRSVILSKVITAKKRVLSNWKMAASKFVLGYTVWPAHTYGWYSEAFWRYAVAEGTALLRANQLLWKKALPRAKILASARLRAKTKDQRCYCFTAGRGDPKSRDRTVTTATHRRSTTRQGCEHGRCSQSGCKVHWFLEWTSRRIFGCEGFQPTCVVQLEQADEGSVPATWKREAKSIWEITRGQLSKQCNQNAHTKSMSTRFPRARVCALCIPSI